jgi:hypothetical protein
MFSKSKEKEIYKIGQEIKQMDEQIRLKNSQKRRKRNYYS